MTESRGIELVDISYNFFFSFFLPRRGRKGGILQ
jgi:hypothetical protein